MIVTGRHVDVSVLGSAVALAQALTRGQDQGQSSIVDNRFGLAWQLSESGQLSEPGQVSERGRMASDRVNVLVASPLEAGARRPDRGRRPAGVGALRAGPAARAAVPGRPRRRSARPVRRRPGSLGGAAAAGRRQLRLRLAGRRPAMAAQLPAAALGAGHQRGSRRLPRADRPGRHAAGVHDRGGRARPSRWPSSPCSGCSTSPRTCPGWPVGSASGTGSGTRSASWPAAGYCWSAWAASAGQVARLLAAAGVEVTGDGRTPAAPGRAGSQHRSSPGHRSGRGAARRRTRSSWPAR